MSKTFNLIGALFFLCWHAFGQSDYRPGLIMPKRGDSIAGLIDYRNDIKNTTGCSFKSNDVVRSYQPFELYGYRFTHGKFYLSKYLKKNDQVTPLFVEYLVSGKKSLYYSRDGAGSHFLIDYKKDTVIEVVYKVDVVYQDGVEIVGDSKIHQAYLKSYFNDCPSVYKDIDAIEVPSINNMVQLTKKYNRLTCGDSGCIVFYKKPYRFRADVELRFGMVQYPEYSTKFEPQYAGFVHFWLPRSNERMYIVTGFSYSPLENYGNNYTIYKVPLKFEYQLPFRLIRPRFMGGVNFMVVGEDKRQAGIGINFPVSAGVMICPFKFLGIDLSVEGELWPFFGLQEFKLKNFLFAYSFNTGICFRF